MSSLSPAELAAAYAAFDAAHPNYSKPRLGVYTRVTMRSANGGPRFHDGLLVGMQPPFMCVKKTLDNGVEMLVWIHLDQIRGATQRADGSGPDDDEARGEKT